MGLFYACVVELLSVCSHCLLFGGRVDLSLASGAILVEIVVQKWSKCLLDTVLTAEFTTPIVIDPCTLIFSIATLDFLVWTRQDLFLEYLGTLPFVYPGNFEYLSGVEPGIRPTTHNSNPMDLHFVDRYTRVYSLYNCQGRRDLSRTEVYGGRDKTHSVDLCRRWRLSLCLGL